MCIAERLSTFLVTAGTLVTGASITFDAFLRRLIHITAVLTNRGFRRTCNHAAGRVVCGDARVLLAERRIVLQ